MDSSNFVGLILHGKYWGQFTAYEHVAMYALVVYDWLNCFGDELSLVKTPGISPAKLAYLFCRYWPLATYPVGLWVDVPDHTHELCEKIFRLPLILQVLNFTGPALVISIRVHAFTGRSTSLSVLLTACLVIFTLYQFWVMTTQAALNPQFGCFPVDVGPAKHLAGHFLAPLLFDCIAILIVIVHAIRTIPFHLWSASTITRVFITDGVYYFVMILYLHVFNAFMSFQSDRAISGVGVPLDLLLPSILACRLVLNLRRAVLQDPDVPSNDKFGDRSSLTAFKAKTVETKMSDGTAVMIQSWPTDDSHPSYVYQSWDARHAPRYDLEGVLVGSDGRHSQSAQSVYIMPDFTSSRGSR